MSTTCNMFKDENGVKVDEKLYRAMIGSLLYLTASLPNICYSVGVCARYQASPRMSHMNALKQIIKYVKERQICDCSTPKILTQVWLVFVM